MDSAGSGDPWPECLTRTVALWFEDPTVVQAMTGMKQLTAAGTLADFDLSDRLAEIEVPVLLVTGAHDRVRPWAAEKVQARLARSLEHPGGRGRRHRPSGPRGDHDHRGGSGHVSPRARSTRSSPWSPGWWPLRRGGQCAGMLTASGMSGSSAGTERFSPWAVSHCSVFTRRQQRPQRLAQGLGAMLGQRTERGRQDEQHIPLNPSSGRILPAGVEHQLQRTHRHPKRGEPQLKVSGQAGGSGQKGRAMIEALHRVTERGDHLLDHGRQDRCPDRRRTVDVVSARTAIELYPGPMSNPAVEPSLPPVDETAVRAHAHQLRALAADYGITDLRFASIGRLVGHVAQDRDSLDVADFELAAIRLLGADVHLYSDRVLGKANVSPDLVAAQPL